MACTRPLICMVPCRTVACLLLALTTSKQHSKTHWHFWKLTIYSNQRHILNDVICVIVEKNIYFFFVVGVTCISCWCLHKRTVVIADRSTDSGNRAVCLTLSYYCNSTLQHWSFLLRQGDCRSSKCIGKSKPRTSTSNHSVLYVTQSNFNLLCVELRDPYGRMKYPPKHSENLRINSF